jgi:hypothetical protein
MLRPALARDAILIAALALRYAAVTAPLFALWEVAQLPLYTIWWTEGLAANLAAAAHCTAGDALLAFATVFVGLLVALRTAPETVLKVAFIATLTAGVAATIVIEFVSTQWLGRWAYSAWMPIEPLLGTGVSPILQWLLIPSAGLFALRNRIRGLAAE